MNVLRILLLEDSLLDAELIEANLLMGGIECELIRVETREQFANALTKECFDLILADYSLPAFDGFSALEIARSICVEVPFIFVSATLGEDIAIETLKSGATDYVVKQRLERLIPAVKRALREAQERVERQQAEAALRDALQRLTLHVDNSPLAVVEWDREFRVTRWSKEAERMFGWRLEEVRGLHPADWKFVYTEDAVEVNQIVSQLLEGKQRRNLSVNRNYRKNGEVIYCEWYNSALADDAGKLLSVQSLVLEVTDRKQAEEERRQHTIRLQKLAQASVAINSTLSLNEMLQLITEQSREIIGAHQAVTSMTLDDHWSQGINAVSLSPKYDQWHDYEQQPDGSGIYSLVCRLQEPMRMTQAELETHPAWQSFGKEASRHPPMRGWLAVPLISRDRICIGVIQLSDKYEGEFSEEDEATLVQLAQMASTAIDNARLYEASQQANRIKDEFLAVLSHELRSPLNAILGWTKLLQTRHLSEEKRQRALETIERNARLQTQLIEDLLDTSRILRGKLNLQFSPLNLANPVEAAIETMRLAAEAKSIQIHATMNSVGMVLGDANRLQQIVWNLLSNAIKFTPSGGRVEVQVQGEDEFAYIQVRDTGKGINREFLPHVFEYFRQADGSSTRTEGGLGLGLAIVRHLVELHGGTVSAESPGIGLGATFTVKLPMQPNEPLSPEVEKTPLADLCLLGLRILVVDDDADTRELVTFMLAQYGADIRSVNSVSSALDSLAGFQPDIVVSDIGMPHEDGYQLLEKMRSHLGKQMLPAIALTAYAREEDRTAAMVAGFQYHFAKPVEPTELVSAIASLIQTPV